MATELAKGLEASLGKADWKRLCYFADGFVDRLSFQLVRFAKEDNAEIRGKELRRWLLTEARELRDLVVEMPGFIDELGGVMWSEAYGSDLTGWTDLEPDIQPWLESVLSTTNHILAWQLGGTPELHSFGQLLSAAKELELESLKQNSAFKQKLKSHRKRIAQQLYPEIATQYWAIFVSPTVENHEAIADSNLRNLGPFAQVPGAEWSSEWRVLRERLLSHGDQLAAATEEAHEAIRHAARIPANVQVATQQWVYPTAPSHDTRAWWNDRTEGWAWIARSNRRSVAAHAERMLEAFGGLATLASSDGADTYFGPVEMSAGVIGYRDEEKPEVEHVEAQLPDLWVPHNPGLFLEKLLGRARVTKQGFHRIFSDLETALTDNKGARHQLRRSLYFWARGERTYWRLKTQPQSLWAIGDALVSYFSALEVILRDNDRGAVVKTLSSRAASLVAIEADQRLSEMKRVKKLYGLRCEYVHSGQASVRREDLLETRDITRACLLDFVRWIAASGSDEWGPHQELGDEQHLEYVLSCKRRSLGG